MKQRIPSDVERLMWLVAESNDPNAITDFEARFPEFSLELARRRRMVTDLKGARAHLPSESRIPAFTPTTTQVRPVARGTWLVGGLALAALAVASYSITSRAVRPEPVVPRIEPVNTAPITVPNTTVYEPPPVKQPQPQQNPAQVQTQQEPPTSNQEQLKTMKLSNTSLTQALKMIGDMAGYKVEIAPGFEDQQVSIDYDGYTTSYILKDMGMRYGFTAFDQGDGTIIIVPAVDGGPPKEDTSGSQRRIGG